MSPRRLPPELFSAFRPPPQTRYGTVTSIGQGICTVRVAGGEIPVITINGAPLNVGDFVAVQRQGVASYLLASPSGAIWLPARQNGGAGQYAWRVTSGGQQSGYSLGNYYLSEYPNVATTHPNGSVWIGGEDSSGNGAVWRIDPKAGTVTKGDVTFAGSICYGLCVGPDGNIWASFFSPAQTLASFDPVTAALLGTVAIPSQIAVGQIITGPDGNIWLADQSLPGVWSYDLATQTWHSVPLGASFPQGLYTYGSEIYVADGYGAVWVVTPPDGTAFYQLGSAYPYPVIDGYTATPEQIVVTSTGVWMTDDSIRLLKFVIGVGTVSYFINVSPLPDMLGLCLGKDGNLWAAGSSGEGNTTVLAAWNQSGTVVDTILVEVPAGYPEPTIGYQITAGP